MKIIDKIFYWILSVATFVISIILIFGILNIFGLGEKIFLIPVNIFKDMSFNASLTYLIISVVFLLISIKGMFFQSKNRKETRDGILLENNNGKLSISKETIQNLIKDVAEDIDGIEVYKSDSWIGKAGMLSIKIDLNVYKDVNIKEITKDIQEKVKHAIKNMTDIEAKEINVNVKNILNKKLKNNKTEENKEKNIEKEEKNV